MSVIALIPTTGQRNIKYLLQDLNEIVKVDKIEIFTNEIPIGIANAKNEIIKIVLEKYSKDDYFLMIDDDTIIFKPFNIQNDIDIFLKDKSVGIIGLQPNTLPGYENRETFLSFNPCIIRGNVLFDNIKYDNSSYPDDVKFGFDAWLAGYKIMISENRMMHHSSFYNTDTPNNLSIVDILYRERKLNLVNPFTGLEDLFTFDEFDYLGYKLPRIGTIIPTEKAIAMHNENNLKLLA